MLLGTLCMCGCAIRVESYTHTCVVRIVYTDSYVHLKESLHTLVYYMRLEKNLHTVMCTVRIELTDTYMYS